MSSRVALRVLVTTAALLFAGLGTGATAIADELTEPRVVDLLSEANLTVSGDRNWDGTGAAVDAAGDVNGDGRDDVIIGAPFAGNNDRRQSGSAYVMFGQSATTKVDVRDVGGAGFRIDGPVGYDRNGDTGSTVSPSRAGHAVAGAGDVNGDGLDDVIVGAPNQDSPLSVEGSPDGPGSAFVVFGKRSTGNVDLAALGSAGFEIVGPSLDSSAGESVDGAGDVDGDGRDDVVVGAPGANSAYVVFGNDSPDSIQLAVPGTAALRLSGFGGGSVAGAGDVNGDGRDDVVVGGAGKSVFVGGLEGPACVVYGTSSKEPVDVGSLGTRGFCIGPATEQVAAAGDVNGDGRDDILLHRHTISANRWGSAWVVFGKPGSAAVDLNALGTGGFRIDSGSFTATVGFPWIMSRDPAWHVRSIAGAGDLNGDGRDDVIIGHRAGWVGSQYITHRDFAYVVFGKTSSSRVALTSLGAGGFRLDGVPGARAGAAVGGAADIAGDGRPEVIIGEPMGCRYDQAGCNQSSWGWTGAAYGASAPALIGLSTTSGPPTTVIQVSGSGFAPGETVTVSFDGTVVGTGVASAAGNLKNVRAPVPGAARPGIHRFRAVGQASGRSAERAFLVRTSWGQYGFAAARGNFNAYENVLGRSTVAGLTHAWAGAAAIRFAGATVVAGGYAHAASTDGRLLTFDRYTGAALWSRQTGGAISSSPAVASGIVYVGSHDGVLSAFDARTGAPRWTKQTAGPLASAPAVSSGVLYAHSDDGFLYALDALTGAERWRAEVGHNGGAAPAVASNRVHVVSGTNLVTLSTATGAQLWTAGLGGDVNRSTPAVVAGVVYVGTGRDGTLLAINAKTGATVWVRDLSEGVPTDLATPVVGTGVVYVRTTNGFHALKASTGETVWIRPEGGPAGSDMALANGVLYLPGPRALTSATGATLWWGGEGDAAPTVVDGILYVGASGYRVP